MSFMNESRIRLGNGDGPEHEVRSGGRNKIRGRRRALHSDAGADKIREQRQAELL